MPEAYGRCEDTPLSIAVAVADFLTFAIALLFAIIGYIALTAGALEEIQRITEDLSRGSKLVGFLLDYCLQETQRSSAAAAEFAGLLTSITSWQVATEELIGSMGRLHTNNVKGSRWFNFQFWRRISWVLQRQRFVEKLTSWQNLKNELVAAQITMLLR